MDAQSLPLPPTAAPAAAPFCRASRAAAIRLSRSCRTSVNRSMSMEDDRTSPSIRVSRATACTATALFLTTGCCSAVVFL